MNRDILKGKWNQIKGDVKKTFGKLTDNDMLVIEGDANKAVGLLQERYGYTREEAEKQWNEFTKLHTAQDVKNDARSAVNKANSKM
jgi:uncharacterized protein YjbJ (UPF0337 family)